MQGTLRKCKIPAVRSVALQEAPTDRDALSDNVTKVVQILMAAEGMRRPALADALGFDSGTMSRVLHGKRRWSLGDIAKLSEIFDRPAGFFLEPAESLIRNRCFRVPEQLVLEYPPAVELVEQLALPIAMHPAEFDQAAA